MGMMTTTTGLLMSKNALWGKGDVPSHGRGHKFEPCIAHHRFITDRAIYVSAESQPDTRIMRFGG